MSSGSLLRRFPTFHINPHPHSVYMLTQCLVFKIGIYHHITHFINSTYPDYCFPTYSMSFYSVYAHLCEYKYTSYLSQIQNKRNNNLPYPLPTSSCLPQPPFFPAPCPIFVSTKRNRSHRRGDTSFPFRNETLTIKHQPSCQQH